MLMAFARVRYPAAATAIAAVAAVTALAGCLSRTVSYTFAQMPETCDELTGEFRDALFEVSSVSGPDETVSAERETRLLSCVVSGGHPDLPSHVRTLYVSVTQAAHEVEVVNDVPVDGWLREQAAEWLRDQGFVADACDEPEQFDVDGASFAVSCGYVEQDVYVTALVSAVDTDARAWVGLSATMTRDSQEIGLPELSSATEDLVRSATTIVVSQLG